MPDRRCVAVLLALLGLTCSLNARAQAGVQEQSDATAVEIKHKLMYFKIGFWSGITLHQDGKELPIGWFGSDAERYFLESPEAQQDLRTFRSHRITGAIFEYLGLGASVAAGIYLGSSLHDGTFQGSNTVVFWSLLGGGLLSTVIGLVFTNSALSHFVEAVNKYNAALLNKHLPSDQKIDLTIFATAKGNAVGLSYRF